MLQSQQHILTSTFTSLFPFSLPHPHSHFLSFIHTSTSTSSRPISLCSAPPRPRPKPEPWLAQAASEPTTATTGPTTPEEEEEGPIELFQSTSPIFATSDDPSAIQVATSVLLTGAISVFLFRSLRRRARRAKELKFRSEGVKKSVKEEALDSLKAMRSVSIEAKSPDSPPSPVQALLGGISAGVIALILFKFTTTIEAALNRQTISDNFSVRQITITIRTIVNGLCYLATFVFGINSVGLILYAGQLGINSFMEGSTDKETDIKGDDQSGSLSSTTETPTNTGESGEGNQSSDDSQ
ncbi:Transmembrane protein [Parasponia andersonii]|uniref:Transmembrane protein n=1 Tax=Parasponia andersonii TaxID=3476 RepID=A0A2P5AR33_PARAD|nr:Transmembrane protein [Parasponia andersonii]